MEYADKPVRAKTILLIFLVLLGGIALINLLTPEKTFSENENRYLKKRPEFSLEALFHGNFTADFDEYIIDQFALRDRWVGIKALSELALQKHASGGVYFAADDYLIEMFDTVDETQYAKNLEAVAEFSRRAEEGLGLRTRVILAPTASRILSDKLPFRAPEISQQALLVQAATAIPGLLDVSEALARHKDEFIYYRTDHHWTSLGAFYAYRDWREAEGGTVPSLDGFDQEILSDRFFGTTYSKASLYSTSPDTITAFLPRGIGPYSVEYVTLNRVTDTLYDRSYLDKKDKYAAFLSGNQPVIHITTSNPNGKRLLLIKDSYANAFVQFALADFSEIHILDLRYYKLSPYAYAEENGITDLLILYNLKGFSEDTNLYYLKT